MSTSWLDPVWCRRAVEGCLLGGAIGDALGAGIEFMRIDEIRAVHGHQGVTGFVPAYGRIGAITDDTQMTLFTAEGLIRASVRRRERGLAHTVDVVYHAYLRWLRTQGKQLRWRNALVDSGWLMRQPELQHSRAPGVTCVGVLAFGERGTIAEPINDSKGCGGVVRAAPVGFVRQVPEAFALGCEVAALTHGHPTGWLTAGVLGAIVAGVFEGRSLAGAVAAARELLVIHDRHEETADALDWAVATSAQGLPTPEDCDRLAGRSDKGAGWVAEEALAIGLRCALAAASLGGDDLAEEPELVRAALLAAVNHTGDSDATGSIAGNLLGALVGPDALPTDLVERVEARAVIATLAVDFATEFGPNPPVVAGPATDAGAVVPDDWWERYPGH